MTKNVYDVLISVAVYADSAEAARGIVTDLDGNNSPFADPQMVGCRLIENTQEDGAQLYLDFAAEHQAGITFFPEWHPWSEYEEHGMRGLRKVWTGEVQRVATGEDQA